MKKKKLSTLQKIQNNYECLKADREYARNLHKELVKENGVLETILSDKRSTESPEGKEIIREVFDRTASENKTYVEWLVRFDEEVKRTKNAIRGLQEKDPVKVRKAFEAFLCEDTSLSIKDLALMFYDIQNCITTLKHFSATASKPPTI